MTVEKTSILKVLSRAKSLYVADYNDAYGVSANMIKKIFQYADYRKSINLGTIVLEEAEEDGGFVVVEGIQKLITLSLVMFAMCECYKQTNDVNEEAISKIYNRYLVSDDTVKIVLNNENKEIYEKLIKREKLTPEEKENPLFIVLHNFWEEIRAKNISANELYKAIKAIEGYVIRIKEGQGLDFYYNINKNSVLLNTPKLIRSYINQKDPFMVNIYDEIVASYVDSDVYQSLTFFLKDFLSIQNTKVPVPESEIFPMFVAYYEDLGRNKPAEKILNNLKDFANRYLKMINIDFEYFDVKKWFTKINEIGGQVAYPYLLEVLTDYDEGKIKADGLNIILKTVFEYLNQGNEFDFIVLSELINQKLVIKKK